jgi:hypothetical protein
MKVKFDRLVIDAMTNRCINRNSLAALLKPVMLVGSRSGLKSRPVNESLASNIKEHEPHESEDHDQERDR